MRVASVTGSASIEVFAVRVTGYDLAGSDGGAFAIGVDDALHADGGEEERG